MEDWIESIKYKLLTEQLELSPGDWERFEARYLVSRRKYRILPWAIAAVSTAAAVLAAFLVLNRPSAPEAPRIEPVSVPTLIAKAEDSIVTVEQETPVQTVRFSAVPRRIASLSQEREAPLSVDSPTTSIDTPIEPEPIETETESKASTLEHVEKSSDNTPDIGLFSQIENLEKKHRKLLAFAPYIKGFHHLENEHIEIQKSEWNGVFTDTPGLENSLNNMVVGIPRRMTHMVPLSFGMDVSLSLTPRLGLTSGLDLSLYRSCYSSIKGTREVQNACYLGIPLRLDWIVQDQGRFSSWLGAGGKADYLVYGKQGNDHLRDDTVHWSAIMDIGIQYRLSPNIGLFIQPEVSYYFKPDNLTILTYRAEHPFTFTLGAGLRLSFGNSE